MSAAAVTDHTAAIADRVRPLAAEGKGDREIGNALGYSESYIFDIRKAYSIPPGNPAPRTRPAGEPASLAGFHQSAPAAARVIDHYLETLPRCVVCEAPVDKIGRSRFAVAEDHGRVLLGVRIGGVAQTERCPGSGMPTVKAPKPVTTTAAYAVRTQGARA